MNLTSFYEPAGEGAFAALEATMSPWDVRLQHGSPPTALLAYAMETAHPREDMRAGRIAVEFLGPMPRGIMRVRTRVSRPGKRIELLEGVLECDGREIVTGRIWRIATQAPDTIPPAAVIATELPPRPEAGHVASFAGDDNWAYHHAIDWRFTQGRFDVPGAAAVWTRVRIPLVAGEALRPLDRLLLVADSANGISAVLPFADWLFVPPSLSLALQRHPLGEWTFMHAATTLGPDGLGVTSARFADDAGELGVGSQSLLVEPRRQTPSRPAAGGASFAG
jgi:hypothetical protein